MAEHEWLDLFLKLWKAGLSQSLFMTVGGRDQDR